LFAFSALQESMDAASKAMQELQEQLAVTKQAGADEASKAAEAHALELQKMLVERTKLEVWPGSTLLCCAMQRVTLCRSSSSCVDNSNAALSV
jgi:hypothetical protein